MPAITTRFRNLTAAQQNLVRSEQITKTLDASLRYQTTIRSSQKQLQRDVIRAYYPLEPITIRYDIEYPLDLPQFSNYLKRVWHKLAGSNNKVESETGELWLTNTKDPPEPPGGEGEEQARKILMTDHTWFEFGTTTASPIATDLMFDCAEKQIFDAAPSKGARRLHIDLKIDLQKHRLVKMVTCENPFRIGDDRSTFSSLELIGRELSWSNFGKTEGQMSRIALRFSYDSANDFLYRFMRLSHGQTRAKITAATVGLSSATQKELESK